MMRVVGSILLSILLVITTSNGEIRGRIISGEIAQKGQLPWQVLLKRYGDVFCGGSIISDSWVLTAAHCTKGQKSLDLVFGIINVNEPGVVMNNVNDFTEHPQYNPNNFNNDVALIRLPQKLKFDANIQPIALNKDTSAFLGESCTVSGWGYMSDDDLIFSENLRFASVSVIASKQCEDFYGNGYVTDSTICTVGAQNSDQSICSGDSGGALVISRGGKTTQIGVNSFVYEEGCSEKQPAGYARISSFIDFIQSVTKLNL